MSENESGETSVTYERFPSLELAYPLALGSYDVAERRYNAVVDRALRVLAAGTEGPAEDLRGPLVVAGRKGDRRLAQGLEPRGSRQVSEEEPQDRRGGGGPVFRRGSFRHGRVPRLDAPAAWIDRGRCGLEVKIPPETTLPFKGPGRLPEASDGSGRPMTPGGGCGGS